MDAKSRDLLRYLYDWVRDLPVKHPQQAQVREQVRKLLEGDE